jgi:type VI secretion system lysozyme-like protein
MAKTPSKERLLPSLLDRLTDDDPLNSSIDLLRIKIQHVEKLLQQPAKRESQSDADEKRTELLEELNRDRAQFLFLTSSVSSLKEIRDCVKRDLDWLFNTHSFAPAEQLENYPDVASSVLNYGLPDFSGKTASGIDVYQLEKLMKQAILNFEPRLMRQSLNVRLLADESAMNHNALTFEIESEMWSEPVPIHLHLRTELELENGAITVAEF